MSDYISRTVDLELGELLGQLPAIAVDGAKGVGKTATASRRAGSIHALDDPGQRSLAIADPDRLLGGDRPVLLDEWQRVPESWDLVRRAVDAGAAEGSFLLTGSTQLAAADTHSGAGRIVTVRMRPLSLAERGVKEPTVSIRELLEGGRPPIRGTTSVRLGAYVEEIVASGFPGLRGLSGRALRAQLDGYVDRIVDRDFPELGRRVRNPAALRRWMAAYAAATATTTSFEKIRDAATSDQGDKPAKATAIPYRDVLERLWVLDPLPAWLPTRRRISRLSSPLKHHLVDPALAARILGVDERALLGGGGGATRTHARDGALLGSLFESLLTLSVRVYAQAAEGRVGHLRMAGGEREIDLIIERGDGRILAIEVKLARDIADRDVSHLRWLRDRIGDDELLDAIVITTGEHAYRRRDGIAVVPAALLGP
jgi:predicted AAA+ superfamily ATPase